MPGTTFPKIRRHILQNVTKDSFILKETEYNYTI